MPFSFPEQTEQRLSLPGGDLVIAREVAVVLVDVQVPRLRRLLGDRALDTYEHALNAGQDAVEAAVVVTVTVNLATGALTVNEVAISLSESEFVWFATLAAACAEEGGAWVTTQDVDAPRAMLRRIGAARGAGWSPGAAVWKKVLAGEDIKEDASSLGKIRSTTASHFLDRMKQTALPRGVIQRAALAREYFGETNGPGRLSKWRLPLEAAKVVVVDRR